MNNPDYCQRMYIYSLACEAISLIPWTRIGQSELIKVAYKDIFAITCIKTMAVFLVIGTYFLSGWV